MKWMSHRKWKETKQQPGTATQDNILGCCLVSLRFLCDIYSIHSVLIVSYFPAPCTKSCAMPPSLRPALVPRRLVFQSRNVQSHLSLSLSLPKNRKTSQEKKMEESCREKWHAKENCLKKHAEQNKNLE